MHLKPVQIGVTTETSSQILGGITDGERVIVDGTDRLVEGAQVRVRKAGDVDNPAADDSGAGAGGRRGRGMVGGRRGGAAQ